MAWIGLCTAQTALFDPSGVPFEGAVPPNLPTSDQKTQQVPRGTLMLETDFAPGSKPQTLLEYRRSHPWQARISLQLTHDGTLVMDLRKGDVENISYLPTGLRAGASDLRITFGWDTAGGTACLSVYDPQSATLWQQILPAPQPLMLEDLRSIILSPARRHMGREVTFLALSDLIEPVGPQPGLASHAVVETPSGPAPIGRIRAGDRVHTCEAAAEPVLQPLVRDLPALGLFRPICLRRPYFGLSRDLIVSAETLVLCQGPDVEYLFGEEGVLVQAGHLEGTKMVVPVTGFNVLRYHQLLCAEHEVLWIAGARVSSQYMGAIGRDPVGAATSHLAGFMRRDIPLHHNTAYPVLKGYEAVTLNAARAA